MSRVVEEVLKQDNFSKEDILYLLSLEGKEKLKLFECAAQVKRNYVDDKVYFRGLIEFSNVCEKDCFYCGIRHSNKEVKRYNLSDDEILKAAKFAYDQNYGSIVMQSGEIMSPAFTQRITKLLKDIASLTDNQLRVTLSLGEQTEETYKTWFDAGAHRYLLRIESSNPQLYRQLHPDDEAHSFDRRLEALKALKKVGYQTGTGIMIGVPFQTMEDIANDLLFIRDFDVDMIGLGPYIEHKDTPLYQFKATLLPLETRFQLTLKFIAILRLIMKDINIAAATALQAIDKIGREKAIKVGANVIMPNITPGTYRDDYQLYENKPCTDEEAEDCKNCLEVRIALADNEIAYGQWGDSRHYRERKK